MKNNTLIAMVLIIVLIVVFVFLFLNNNEQIQEVGKNQGDGQQSVNEIDQTATSSAEQGTTTMTDSQKNENEVVVEYTQTGFIPDQVTISVGKSVTFKNTSNRDMWVASDIHPTHAKYQNTILSEHCADGPGPDAFDQCESGDIYTFTFNKVGDWSYHNHLNAQHTGTVLVRPSE